MCVCVCGNIKSTKMAKLKYLVICLCLLLSVVAGIEEHGDPKEHSRREGKSKFLKHFFDKTISDQTNTTLSSVTSIFSSDWKNKSSK